MCRPLILNYLRLVTCSSLLLWLVNSVVWMHAMHHWMTLNCVLRGQPVFLDGNVKVCLYKILPFECHLSNWVLFSFSWQFWYNQLFLIHIIVPSDSVNGLSFCLYESPLQLLVLHYSPIRPLADDVLINSVVFTANRQRVSRVHNLIMKTKYSCKDSQYLTHKVGVIRLRRWNLLIQSIN